jgi:hypothetical protein
MKYRSPKVQNLQHCRSPLSVNLNHSRRGCRRSNSVPFSVLKISFFSFKNIVSQVLLTSTFCVHFWSFSSWPFAQPKHLDLRILNILCMNHGVEGTCSILTAERLHVCLIILPVLLNSVVTQLFHWTAHITAHSFLVAFGDIKAVHTHCNMTPMNASINPSRHSGCCTYHLLSHQELFILATSRFYGCSVGGFRPSKRCSWEHISSDITVVRRYVLGDQSFEIM